MAGHFVVLRLYKNLEKAENPDFFMECSQFSTIYRFSYGEDCDKIKVDIYAR